MAHLKATISRMEFLRWWEFHRRNPFDPVSLHLRPAALIAYTQASHGHVQTKLTFRDYCDMLFPQPEEDEAMSIFESFLR